MTDLEIRQRIAAFTDGEVEPHDLEDWLETAAWDLDAEPAKTLAADALRLLAEYGNGDWTDVELRERLGALYRTYWFAEAPKTQNVTGSDSIVIHQDQRSASPERLRVTESV